MNLGYLVSQKTQNDTRFEEGGDKRQEILNLKVLQLFRNSTTVLEI